MPRLETLYYIPKLIVQDNDSYFGEFSGLSSGSVTLSNNNWKYNSWIEAWKMFSDLNSWPDSYSEMTSDLSVDWPWDTTVDLIIDNTDPKGFWKITTYSPAAANYFPKYFSYWATNDSGSSWNLIGNITSSATIYNQESKQTQSYEFTESVEYGNEYRYHKLAFRSGFEEYENTQVGLQIDKLDFYKIDLVQ